jgi:hypothetical protein
MRHLCGKNTANIHNNPWGKLVAKIRQISDNLNFYLHTWTFQELLTHNSFQSFIDIDIGDTPI